MHIIRVGMRHIEARPWLIGGVHQPLGRLHIKTGHGIFTITNRTTKLKVFVISSDLSVGLDQGCWYYVPDLSGT